MKNNLERYCTFLSHIPKFGVIGVKKNLPLK